MTAREVFDGSDGEVTRKYYADLCGKGPIGIIAMNLFRAQKCSARAKVYRGGIRGQGSYKRMAYDRKAYSMSELCRTLAEHGAKLGFAYGWRTDPKTVFGERASWVLYVDIPDHGQASFHSPSRGVGPDYTADWDQASSSEVNILAFCDFVVTGAVQSRWTAVAVDDGRSLWD